jgi:hypothetical protein
MRQHEKEDMTMRLFKILVMFVALAGAAHAKERYYGAVDLGSKGTKAFLYSFVQDENGFDANVLFKKSINTKLASSMKENRFTPEGISEAADAVRQLIDEMKAEASKKHISNVEFYVVGSSAVAKSANRDELVAAVKTASGNDMTFVDARDEGYFGLVSSVPRKRRGAAILVDIGSGNTKVGCVVGDSSPKNYKSAEIPFGSVSGRNEGAKQNPTDIKAGIQKLMEEQVGPAYAKESMDTPCLRNRQRVYWIGGAAWAAATFMRPDAALAGFVVLTRRDLTTFLDRLNDGSWNQKDLILDFDKDVPAARRQAVRTKAEKEREDVMNVFVREDLISGVSIMKTLLDASNPSAVIWFARNGNYIYGYALEKFSEDQ